MWGFVYAAHTRGAFCISHCKCCMQLLRSGGACTCFHESAESVVLLRTSMDGWCHLSESPSILSPAYSLLLPLAGRLVLQVQAAQLMQRALPFLLVVASIGL